MHILFVCPEYHPEIHGGIGVFVKTLAENLVRLNVQCVVIGLYDQIDKYSVEFRHGVEIRRARRKKWLLGKLHPVFQLTLERYQLSCEIRKIEKSKSPDLIESFEWSGPLFKKPRSRLIVRLHGSNSAYSHYERKKLSKLLYFWERRNLKFADYIISVSRFMLQVTQDTFKIKNVRTTVIYNFIDHKLFYLNPRISRNPNKIIFVGKFHERKGVYELFQILNHLLPLNDDYFFEFVGNHTVFQKSTLLTHLDPFLRSRVTFTGSVRHEQLPEMYNSAALMIMPSRAEAFGLTAIEAMACGCVVAMANRATGPELIVDGVDGILINAADAERSAITLHKVLSNSTLLNNIRSKAIEKSLQFSSDQIIPQNLAFYKSVIASDEF